MEVISLLSQYLFDCSQVCNHPELFERADVVAPFSFCKYGKSGPINREGDFLILPYSTRSPIEYSIPLVMYQDGGILEVPFETSISPSQSGCLNKLLNIWSTDWIHRSLYDDGLSINLSQKTQSHSSSDAGDFSFLRFADVSASEAHQIHVSPLLRRRLMALEKSTAIPDIYYSL